MIASTDPCTPFIFHEPYWCQEMPLAPALISFFDMTSSNLNDSVAWVAVGYVNSTPCRCCRCYPPQNAMIHGFLIHQTSPHTHCICPVWNGAHTSPFQKNLLRGDPPSPRFFPRGGQSHNDTAPFSDASLPRKYLPPSSSPPHIKHLLKKALFLTSRSPPAPSGFADLE